MGGHSSKAQPGYQPTWQGGADQNFQGLIQNATPWVSQLPGQVIPGMQSAAQNIGSNPYAGQAQQGANNIASLGQSYAGDMGARAATLNNLGGLSSGMNDWQAQTLSPMVGASQNAGAAAAGYGQTAANVGQRLNQDGKAAFGETQGMIPNTTNGWQYADPALMQAAGMAGMTSGTALGAIPGLTGGMDAAQQVLQTGFDPQGALYDRQYQQTMDQQNAIASQYGVAGGAYGAGLAGDASRNFNIDWQNNQLSRQTQALGAYGQEQGQVTNDLTSLLGSASNNYANLTNAGVNQYNELNSGAVNNLNNLVSTGMNARAQGASAYQAGLGQAMQGQQINLQGLQQAAGLTNDIVNNNIGLNNNTASMFSNASQQNVDAQNMQLTSSQLPYQTYMGQQGDYMQALQGLAQGAGAALQPTTGLGSMDSDYMRIGQSATALQQKSAEINNQTRAANNAAIGQMVGTAASVAMHFI